MAPRILWRRTRIFFGVVLALALIAQLALLIAVNWRPSLAAFSRQGIDVGERNGAIDWRRVGSVPGLSFAYIRATKGADTDDSRFAANWTGAYEAGLKRGAVHVFSLCQLASDQAGNLVRAVTILPDDLAVALELDFDPACSARPDRDVVIAEIARFLVGVEGSTGKPVVLKISRAFEQRYRVSAAIRRPLWSAQPFFPPSYFDKPWRMWQASSFRRVDGVAGGVNWDVMAQ